MGMSDEERKLIEEFNLPTGEGDPSDAEIKRRGLQYHSWDYQPDPEGPMFLKLTLRDRQGNVVASRYGFDVKRIRADALRQVLEAERGQSTNL